MGQTLFWALCVCTVVDRAIYLWSLCCKEIMFYFHSRCILIGSDQNTNTNTNNFILQQIKNNKTLATSYFSMVKTKTAIPCMFHII